VDKQLISQIGRGVLIFAAVAPGDTEKEVEALAAKVLKMRLWDDEAGGRVCSIDFLVDDRLQTFVAIIFQLSWSIGSNIL
jgi:D-Tyr-tRNAtyr deacylase